MSLRMSAPRSFVPKPRRRGVVSEQVDGETLLYVEATHQASSLNGPASRIWALCDGERRLETIADEAKLQPDVVVEALRKLADAGLLENGAEIPPNLLRRRMLVGMGLAGPVILMVTAPWAKAAASVCIPKGGDCTANPTGCCTGLNCVPPIGAQKRCE